jgi:hypothetical protein
MTWADIAGFVTLAFFMWFILWVIFEGGGSDHG